MVDINTSINVGSLDVSTCHGINAQIFLNTGSSWAWSPSKGLNCISCQNPVVINPTLTTSYNVTASSGACTSFGFIVVHVDELPTITISGITTICQGGSCSLTASGANSYTWSPGIGLDKTSESHVIASPVLNTTYTLAGKNEACISYNELTISVSKNPSLFVSPNPSVCFGTGINLSAFGADSYYWYPANDLSSTTGRSVFATPLITSTFTVIGKNDFGCTSVNMPIITVSIYFLPSISVSPPITNLCTGETSGLTASANTLYYPISYIWNPVDPGSSIDSIVTVSINHSTSISVKGTDINGCSNTAIATIVVNPIPVLVISPSSPSVCKNIPLPITASGAINYIWFPSESLNSSIGPIVTASPAVESTYTVFGFDDNGCSSNLSFTLPLHELPNVKVSVSNSSICSGYKDTMNVSGALSYTWMPEASQLSVTSFIVNPTVSTTYIVTGTDVNNCMNTDTVSIGVYPADSVYTGLDDTIALGATLKLLAKGSGTEFFWSPSASLSCSHCPSPVASPIITTTYYITMTNQGGCVYTDSISVFLNEVCEIFVPDAFSPNGDNNNDTLFVRSYCIKSIAFNIFNRWGQKVFETFDIHAGWDGNVKAEKLHTEILFFNMDAELLNNTSVHRNGTILLVK